MVNDWKSPAGPFAAPDAGERSPFQRFGGATRLCAPASEQARPAARTDLVRKQRAAAGKGRQGAAAGYAHSRRRQRQQKLVHASEFAACVQEQAAVDRTEAAALLVLVEVVQLLLEVILVCERTLTVHWRQLLRRPRKAERSEDVG